MTDAIKPIRFGLIGPGKFADKWRIPALRQQPDAQLWSVLGHDLSRTRDFALRHEAQAVHSAHTDIEQFLQDPDLDAVIVASPDRMHAQHAMAAAAAGKHLLVEKPLAANYDDAIDILNACQDAGVQLATGYHLRWHAGHRLLQQKLHAGDLGELQHMRVQWTYTADPAEKNTTRELTRWWSLSAVGTHAIDLVTWFMTPTCGQITEIKCCHQHRGISRQQDESAIVAMRFASGATAVVTVSVTEKRPRLIEITGSKAKAVCSDTLGPRGAGQIVIGSKTMDFTVVNPYAAEMESFVRSIRTDSAHETDGGVGLTNVGWLERLSQ